MRGSLVLLFIISNAFSVCAQSFIGEASLPPVAKDGFYRIKISPEAAIYLTNDFNNIRIYDNADKEVPFILQEEEANRTTQEFKDYEILEKKQKDGCCTSLMLHNPDQSQLNSISLIIKNADVTKEATLLGSDDKEHWYALKQHFTLYPAVNTNGTSELKIVDFPLSNYVYYSLRINDSTSAPINILKAGYFQIQSENGEYTGVPLTRISLADSAVQKRSYLHFQFDTLRLIDKLELSMKGQPYFLRKATLYVKKERILKKGGSEKFYDLLQTVELNSKHPTQIGLGGIKVQDMLLIIENKDNPPLEVASAKAYQLNRFLIAWIEAGKQYMIRIKEDQFSKPVYDLSFFKDRIPDYPETLSIGDITVFKNDVAKPGFTLFTTKAFVWAAVIFVIVILGFMSVRLLREAGSAEHKG